MAKPGVNISRLLDCWNPPSHAQDPIGCITTSFTFDSEFFEEECLSRFMQMDSDPKEDGPLYLIEREEKLSQIEPISVIVDEAHCRGKRSLRWDLIGFRSPHLLHSKITLLVWAKHIRIIIASANLTDSGYRQNQEVFGIFDFSEINGVDLSKINSVLDFFKEISIQLNQENPAIDRLNKFIKRIPELITSWGKQKTVKGIEQKIMFTGIGYKNLLQQLNLEVRKKNTLIDNAFIVSPFYVDSKDKNPAIKLLTKILAIDNNPSISWYGRAEKENDDRERLFYGPPSLKDEPKSLGVYRVNFYEIDSICKDEKNIDVLRQLHLKAIWLESKDYLFYCVGSSNFTTNGLGIAKKANFESNILYIIDKKAHNRTYLEIKGSFPKSTYLGNKVKFMETINNGDERKEDDLKNLPLFFDSVLLDKNENNYFIILKFDLGKELNQKWTIYDEDKNQILESETWKLNKDKTVLIDWKLDDSIPSSLIIILEDKSEFRWSIIAKDSKILPAIEDLSNLDLDILIKLLATNRPLHHTMRKWLINNKGDKQLEIKPIIDPHEKVNVSTFLMRRTRRISYALNMLKFQLERPFYTKSSLNWRFNGPIGVLALANAILREAQSEEEKYFLIAELCLELSNVKISSQNGCLDSNIVKTEIISSINKLISKSKKIKTNNFLIEEYSNSAFKYSLRNV